MNLSLSEQLAFITARIECELGPQKTSPGTDIFFNFGLNDDTVNPVLVANRHVIKDAKQGIFQLTKANNEGDPIIQSWQRAANSALHPTRLRFAARAAETWPLGG